MRTVAFIFARGDSEGVKDKNIKLLAGKPLLAYSIEIARSIPGINDLYVSTDSERIADIARQFGAAVIKRPAALATSTAPEWLAWRHGLEYLASNNKICERFVSLPTTAPLRNSTDIEECLNKLDCNTDIVVSMSEARRSPWFNMVIEKDGYIEPIMGKNTQVTRRQDVPPCYDLTTVCYVAKPDYILSADGIFSGRVRAVIVPPERALDIDTELDFLLAETLMQQRNICA